MSWEKVRLGDVASFINGYAFKPSDWSTKGIPIIRIQDLTKSNSSECNYYEGEISEKYRVLEGDILISWSATLGLYKWKGRKGWLNQHIFKVVFDKLNINKTFFIYLIENVLDVLKAQVHGATMKHITKGKFDNTIVKIPSLEIQKQIAEILDKADALRKKDLELLKHYDTLAQSFFIDMFGNPVKNEKGWDMKQIKLLAKNEKNSVKAGPFGSSLKKEFYVRSGYKIYGQEQVIKDDLTFGDYYINEEKYRSLKSCSIAKGDILISLVGTYGKISIVPDDFEPGIINPRLMKISLEPKLCNNVFFKRLLQTKEVKNHIATYSRGGTMDIVNLGIISNLIIIAPPISLQNQFAEQIKNIELQREKVKEQIKASENLFQALLQKMFS